MRNSTIADKPHDAFVQYAMVWLTPPPKNIPFPMLYDAGFGRLYVKNCKHNWQWTAGAPPFGKGACLQ